MMGRFLCWIGFHDSVVEYRARHSYGARNGSWRTVCMACRRCPAKWKTAERAELHPPRPRVLP